MNATRTFWLSVLAIGFLVGGLGGCNSMGLREERDRLYAQNVEAQATLDKTRAALEAAEADRANLSSEVTRLQGELDAAHVARSVPTGPPVSHGGKGTGFEGDANVDVTESAGKITLRIPGDVLFGSGKIELRTGAQKSLEKIASVIKSKYSDKTIRVEGYTDVDPIKKSDWDDNLELSLQRAAAVDRFLAKKGVSAVRMYAAGFGDHHPSPKGKAASRRVEIVVLLRPEG